VDAASTHLELAFAAANATQVSELKRDILNAMGALATSQGNMLEARRCYEQALTLCAKSSEPDVQGALLGNLGEVCMNLGHANEALEYLQRALTLVSSARHRRWEGNIRCNLGLLHHEEGRSDQARQQLETALEIARDIGYTRLEATVLCNLGIVCAAAGIPSAAVRWHEQAVALASALGDPRAEGQFRTYLGQVLIDGSQYAAASECLAQGETRLRDTRDLIGLALLLCERARLDAALGNHTQAMQVIDEAKRIGQRTSVDASSELGRAIQRAEEDLAATSSAATSARETRRG
jgi:tetratricopeptide (TPR) repeat protein